MVYYDEFVVVIRHPKILVYTFVKHERRCLTTAPNIEKRVENATSGAIFLINFNTLTNAAKLCIECLRPFDSGHYFVSLNVMSGVFFISSKIATLKY